jgi:hypothetical protein
MKSFPSLDVYSSNVSSLGKAVMIQLLIISNDVKYIAKLGGFWLDVESAKVLCTLI